MGLGLIGAWNRTLCFLSSRTSLSSSLTVRLRREPSPFLCWMRVKIRLELTRVLRTGRLRLASCRFRSRSSSGVTAPRSSLVRSLACSTRPSCVPSRSRTPSACLSFLLWLPIAPADTRFVEPFQRLLLAKAHRHYRRQEPSVRHRQGPFSLFLPPPPLPPPHH